MQGKKMPAWLFSPCRSEKTKAKLNKGSNFRYDQAARREPQMSENKPPENDLAEEFRKLGKNLAEALRTAWESPDRKKFQQEIENGINEMGATLSKEFGTFIESPTGQRLRSDVEDLGERIRTGEAQQRAREELMNALRRANIEIQRATERWNASKGAQTGSSEKTDSDEDA
jgi:hypothetical protein